MQERARAAQGHKGPILVVMRPRTSSIGGKLILDPPQHTNSSSSSSKADLVATSHSPFAVRSPSSLGLAAAAAAGMRSSRGSMAGPSAVRQLVPVPLPLGSVRASLGAMSTFEDCYALVSAGYVTLKQAARHLLFWLSVGFECGMHHCAPDWSSLGSVLVVAEGRLQCASWCQCRCRLGLCELHWGR
jgi:hypothetical protein